jgi:hypothetical protein
MIFSPFLLFGTILIAISVDFIIFVRMRMKKNSCFRINFSLVLLVILLHSSCKTTKYVPEGKHLLIENSIEIKGDALNLDEVNAVIRQKPNIKLLGIHFRLRAYNAIDSTKLFRKTVVLLPKQIELMRNELSARKRKTSHTTE